MTFANVGNFQGVVLNFYCSTATGATRGIQVDLQQGRVATMTSANP
jgi:hypothetical protein